MANANESMEFGETPKGGRPKVGGSYLTLQKAIEFGEYDPDKLATFPEWHALSRHAQFELIKQALDNRSRQLWMKWAEINNVINFSKKLHLKKALDNILKQVKIMEEDREDLFVAYSDA